VRVFELPELTTWLDPAKVPSNGDNTRPARLYLRCRGLDASLTGLLYEHHTNLRGYPGVLFPVDGETKNGRIYRPPTGIDKAHNVGPTHGKHWRHPGLQYDPTKPVFITEGILNALSLVEMGHQAIAVLGSGANPSAIDLSAYGPNLILAFDGDKAGVAATKQWTEHYKKDVIRAILPPKDRDWNDCLLRWGSKAADQFKKQMNEFLWFAELALASTAFQYADIYTRRIKSGPGPLFEFDGQLYSCKIAPPGKAGEPPLVDSVHLVANCTIRPVCLGISLEEPDRPKTLTTVDIRQAGSNITSAVRCVLTAEELANPQRLPIVLWDRAQVRWSGDRSAHVALIQQISESGAPKTRAVDLYGYDTLTGAFIFPSFAIKADGKIAKPENGQIEVGKNQKIVPPRAATRIEIVPGGSGPDYASLFRAWPGKARAALAWVCGSWFVDELKDALQFWPFLQFVGPPQTGKSRLTRILSACQCLDEEGIAMTTANTQKGELRLIARRSNLFTALCEGQDRKNTAFEIDSILNLYMVGSALQVRAIRSMDLRTKELPFRSALLFVSNSSPFKTRPQRERVITLNFATEDLTDETRAAFVDAIATPKEAWATTLSKLRDWRCRQGDEFIRKWLWLHEKSRKKLFDSTGDARIAENHACIVAMDIVIREALGIEIDESFAVYVDLLATLKKMDCTNEPETIGSYFLEACRVAIETDAERHIEYLKKTGDNKDRLAIYLPEAWKAIETNAKVQVQLDKLQESLSASPLFVESKKVVKFGTKSKRCWVFKYDSVPDDPDRYVPD